MDASPVELEIPESMVRGDGAEATALKTRQVHGDCQYEEDQEPV